MKSINIHKYDILFQILETNRDLVEEYNLSDKSEEIISSLINYIEKLLKEFDTD